MFTFYSLVTSLVYELPVLAAEADGKLIQFGQNDNSRCRMRETTTYYMLANGTRARFILCGFRWVFVQVFSHQVVLNCSWTGWCFLSCSSPCSQSALDGLCLDPEPQPSQQPWTNQQGAPLDPVHCRGVFAPHPNAPIGCMLFVSCSSQLTLAVRCSFCWSCCSSRQLFATCSGSDSRQTLKRWISPQRLTASAGRATDRKRWGISCLTCAECFSQVLLSLAARVRLRHTWFTWWSDLTLRSDLQQELWTERIFIWDLLR